MARKNKNDDNLQMYNYWRLEPAYTRFPIRVA